MVQLEQIEYAGWKNCLRLTNGKVELVITLDVGPRVIRFGFVDGQNVFKEFEDQVGTNGGDQWLSYGGHRLWHGPEVEPRTYYPDNGPVKHEWDGTTLTLTPPEETSNKLQLSIDITLDPDEPTVRLKHHITNTNVWDVELAPWCLSVMAAGGSMVFPQEKFIAHGESYSAARAVVLWHFTNMSDPRWTWGEKFIQLSEANGTGKQKAGAQNTKGWAAYLLNDDIFVKKFGYDPNAEYIDLGCNCEFYTEPGFLEVETLGPNSRIAPGVTVTHPEQWMLGHVDGTQTDEAWLESNLLPLVDKVPKI